MAEFEHYLSKLKENPSPLLEVVQQIDFIVEENADGFGCIVDDNGFYNRIISLSEFSSNNKNYNLQVVLMRENRSKAVTYEISLSTPIKEGDETLYRLDVNMGVEPKLRKLIQSVEESPILSLHVDTFLVGYSLLDDNTLVELSDHWAECDLTNNEVKEILSNATNFRVPFNERIQGTYKELKEFLAEKSSKSSLDTTLSNSLRLLGTNL